MDLPLITGKQQQLRMHRVLMTGRCLRMHAAMALHLPVVQCLALLRR